MLNHPGVICSVELPSRKDLCLVNYHFCLSSERLKEKKKLQLDYLHQMNPLFFFCNSTMNDLLKATTWSSFPPIFVEKGTEVHNSTTAITIVVQCAL
jgi:hypothetical protein